MKTRIKNRNNVELAVMVEKPEVEATGLAFVVHGLGGFKEQIHIRAIIEAMLEKGYTVISYDAANTLGESDGKMEEATLSNYFTDLEDVVQWASAQDFYQEQFVVAGHSLGGACSIMFAAKHPKKVTAIIPVSSSAGAKYSSREDDKSTAEWKKRGYIEEPSKSKPDVIKRVNWSFMEDYRQHDLVTNEAKEVKCPTLLIVGTEDKRTPVVLQQKIQSALKAPNDLELIEGSRHNPRTPEQLARLKNIIENWKHI